MGRKKGRSNTSIGSSSNSGALFSSSRWWAKNSRPSSITRRCRKARVSTLKPSKRKWRKRWNRRRRPPKAPASNRNDLHGGRLARAARLFALRAGNRFLSFRHGHALLRRQPRHPTPLSQGRVGEPRLSRPALQLRAELQRLLPRKGRHRRRQPDSRLRGHLALGHRDQESLRRHHRTARQSLRRDASLLHLSRRQRHDGLPHHDVLAPRRIAPRPQTHRLALPPLRPDRFALPQAALRFGYGAKQLPVGNHLEADYDAQRLKALVGKQRYDFVL